MCAFSSLREVVCFNAFHVSSIRSRKRQSSFCDLCFELYEYPFFSYTYLFQSHALTVICMELFCHTPFICSDLYVGGWSWRLGAFCDPARRANRSVPTAPWCRTRNTAQTTKTYHAAVTRVRVARRAPSLLHILSPFWRGAPGEESVRTHRPSTPLSVTRLSAPRREPVSPSLRCCAPSGRSRPRAVPVRCLRRIAVRLCDERAARAPGLRF